MKKRIFTLMMAFLAVASGAVWGQDPIDVSWEENKTGNGYSFEYSEESNSRILKINTPGTYVITATGEEVGDNNTNVQISITQQAGTYNITLDGVKSDAYLGNDLDGSSVSGANKYPDRCAFQIGDGTNVFVVNLDWKGNTRLWSGGLRAGINVKPNSILNLKGTNSSASLEVGSYNNSGNGITYGAGIGGDQYEPNFGTINIESGIINAYSRAMGSEGEACGAGIGGGYASAASTSSKGTIIITGGDITAKCNTLDRADDYAEYGAGIGGGNAGTCDQIIIIGGKDGVQPNVKVQSFSGADIGVGSGYSGSDQAEIIIGKWDNTQNSGVTVGEADGNTQDFTITSENYVDGYTTSPSATGTVTMPEGMQIYVANLSFTGAAKFNAYNLELKNDKITEDGDHSLTEGETELNEAGNYYFGAKMQFDLKELACSEKHLFMGWINADGSDIVPVVTDKATFEMPDETPETSGDLSVDELSYSAVWVDDEYEITVKTGTQWVEDGVNTPQIAYSPNEGSSNVLEELKFTITSTLPAELTGLSFSENKLIGTPTLQGAATYKKCDVTASVSLNGGTAKQPISITITVVDENMINSIEIASRNHVYNGLVHNDIPNSGVGGDYLFDAKMTHDITGTLLPGPSPLREGVHYRVYKYSFNGGSIKKAVENSRQSLEVKDAGTYSNITIEALDAVLTNDEYLPILDQTKDLGDAEIVVAKRPMNIDIKFNKQSLEEDEELTWWDDVTITPSAYNKTDNTGIVTSEAEDLKVTGNITYTLNEEGTKATVQISNVKVESNETFKVSNYAITINGDQQYTEGTEIDFPDIVIPVNPSSTGGGTDKRYQLYLANKDYLKTDEKTVEYYEDLKLELFSRHNKKYTDAGGSFTIWYEKDGEANVGGYRLFWSKSGEHGDYQEVKFDPVSEYFRIDNVHSDVYVKIYDADGFPVANEAITAQDFRAYAQPNKIIVITPEPTDVQIISMAGAVVAADKVTGQREFANLAEGVYIVRMGETIVKLQVRN